MSEPTEDCSPKNPGETERRAAFFRALRSQSGGTLMDKKLTELAEQVDADDA